MKNVETSIISNSRHILNMRLDLLPCDSSHSSYYFGTRPRWFVKTQVLPISASQVSLPIRQSSAMEQQAQGLVNIQCLSAILLISPFPVVNLLNSSNKNVIQTFGREPFSRPNFIRAPNSLPRPSPFSFLFVSMLDLCVHSAIDIFNFRVALIRESRPKVGPSTYKCGHKQQFLIFF